jgi:hypothetical protein
VWNISITIKIATVTLRCLDSIHIMDKDIDSLQSSYCDIQYKIPINFIITKKKKHGMILKYKKNHMNKGKLVNKSE